MEVLQLAGLSMAPRSLYVDKLAVRAQLDPLTADSAVLHRHPDPYPEWSVAHLTRLMVLSLCGEAARDAMSTLLRSRAAAVLPASLLLLRYQDPTAVSFSAERRCRTIKCLVATLPKVVIKVVAQMAVMQILSCLEPDWANGRHANSLVPHGP